MNQFSINRNSGRQSRREREKKTQNQVQVTLQSIEEIKRQYDPKSRNRESITESSSPKEKEAHQIAEVLRKYKEGPVQDLIKFFFENKKLINKFIRINQTVINEQF